MPPRLPAVAQFLAPRASAFTALRPMATAAPTIMLKADLPILESSQQAAVARRQIPDRCGVVAYKKGMTSIFNDAGERVPCTVLQFDRPQVVLTKTPEVHGYYAVQIGSGFRHASNVTKPMLGHFAKHEVSPKQDVAEFMVRDEKGLLPPGTIITPKWFAQGQFVDCWAKNKGKGFQGGMKRWGFSGQPASHGNTKTHRAMGSAGQSQGGGSRVLPGKRMAGRMGGVSHTVQNLEVVRVDEDLGIILVKGAVSGPKHSMIHIQDAIKKPPTSELIKAAMTEGLSFKPEKKRQPEAKAEPEA